MLGVGPISQSFLTQREGAPEVELREHEPAQRLQRFLLLRSKFAGPLINHTECSECIAVFIDQRSAGVEANARIGDDQGIVAEALVLQCVGYDHHIRLLDGYGAQRYLTRRFGSSDADLGLKPLAIFVNEGDQSDWRL